MPTLPSWNAHHGPLELRQEEIHLWQADLHGNMAALPALAATLAPDELARAWQLRLERDRTAYILAHGMLRTILARYQGSTPGKLVFRHGPAGKPELTSRAVRFNMSHADDLVLCAVSLLRDVGVDVERVRPEVDQVVGRRLASPRARRLLQTLPQPARRRAFFQTWTRMEAYAKARGHGPTLDEATFERFLDLRNPVLSPPPGDGGQQERWWIHDFSPREGYVAALAMQGGEPRLRFWEWKAHYLDSAIQFDPSLDRLGSGLQVPKAVTL